MNGYVISLHPAKKVRILFSPCKTRHCERYSLPDGTKRIPTASRGERQKIMSYNRKKLSGKVAVVTGASKGIGAEIAVQLAAEGAAVVVNYASSKAGADAVVERITQKDGRAVAVQADLSKPEDLGRLFTESR